MGFFFPFSFKQKCLMKMRFLSLFQIEELLNVSEEGTWLDVVQLMEAVYNYHYL